MTGNRETLAVPAAFAVGYADDWPGQPPPTHRQDAVRKHLRTGPRARGNALTRKLQ